MPTEHPRTQTSWRDFLLRPAVFVGVLAAMVALAVAIAGAISGLISSYYQDRSEQAKVRTAVLLEIIKKEDDKSKALRELIQGGILNDKDGKICNAFGLGGCPIK